MNILGFVKSLVAPVTGLISEAIVDKDKAAELELQVYQLQTALTEKLLSYETQLLTLRASVITAEANGQSKLQRNWRPITMLTFLALVVLDTFGWTEFRLSEEAWALLKLGLGGYVIGRSAEKVVPHIATMLPNKKRDPHVG